MDINREIDVAIESDNFEKIESIALSGKYAPIRVPCIDIFKGAISHYKTIWVDISEIHTTYYDDLSGDQKDFIIETYKDKFNGKKWLDNLIDFHNKKVEKYELKQGIHITQFLKSFNKELKKA